VAGWELLEAGALLKEGLEFRGDIDGSVVSPANIEGGDSDVITADHKVVRLAIVEDKAKHPAQATGELNGGTVFFVERQDDFAITARLGGVWSLEAVVQVLVVVDLTVGRHNDRAVGGDERLRARLGIHNRQTLMGNTVGKIDSIGRIGLNHKIARPVGAAMTETRRARNELTAEVDLGKAGRKDGKDSTHGDE
jgi:hypothetical protein